MKFAAMTLILGMAAFAAKDPAAAPQYDPKTESSFTGTITKVHEAGGALDGVYVTVATKTETHEVYLAPASFVRMLEIPLKTGLTVELTASSITFEAKPLMLARGLTIGKNQYTLRDRSGVPNWLWLTRNAVPTGL